MASSDPPLTTTTDAGREILSEWGAVCAYLAEAVQPGQLKLTVIYDTTDIAVAEEVMEATRKLPQLNGCTIRLGRSRNDTLTSLARRTAQANTRTRTLASPFPFFDLPKELRLCILNYTHLGAQGSHDPLHQDIQLRDNKLRTRTSSLIPRLGPECCYQCNDTRDNCCCPTTHASVSTGCTCRLIPFELFLVSRLMNLEAKEVFFSSNCFNFRPDPSRTVEFLSRLSPLALNSIRRVRFEFMDEHIQQWENETKGQWQQLIEFIGRNLRVTELCFIINAEANWDMCLNLEDEENLGFVYDAYCEIVQQLSKLRGLQDLHLEFSWFRGLEAILERRIMGEQHDSSKGNRYAKATKIELGGWDLPSWHGTA